jgi:soluble lytic murein transglycosylase-like protein
MEFKCCSYENVLSRRRIFSSLYFIIFVISLASPACADIFVKPQPDGTLSFTDCPMGEQWNVYYRERAKQPQAKFKKAHFDQLITDIALKQGMDPDLIKSIVQIESGYNPQALSSKGAIGLMQLMPDTASEMGIDDPWDPAQNITAGTKYFSHLLRKYQGDLMKALAAYNAGPRIVDSYEGIPPYQETRDYVRSVLAIINGGRR